MGGHINPTEEADDDPIAAGLWRELSEEVTLSQITSLTCVGLINETTGGVSDYHTALVYLLETTGEVTVRETEKCPAPGLLLRNSVRYLTVWKLGHKLCWKR